MFTRLNERRKSERRYSKVYVGYLLHSFSDHYTESTDDDDFHWEDEDEEESPPTKPELKSKASTTTLQQPSVSPRESSEDSFDLVSSGNVSETKKKSNESDDGGDSDWE